MEEIRIGVYVCWCGTNIAKMVDVEAIAREVEKMPNVVVSKTYKYMCSDPGQDMILKDIKECKLNRIIVAACSPRIHEFTFRKVLAKAEINPYYFEMANIREHVSWVHDDPEEATKKARALVSAAIHRVIFHEALDQRSVHVEPTTLVIGGGVSGMNAATEIADAGRDVYMVERTGRLGGIAAQVDLSYPFMTSMDEMLEPLIYKVRNHPHIKVFLESEIKEISGYVGNFETTVYSGNNGETHLKFGNVVIATGLKPFDPSNIEEYAYKKYPDVITSLEFESILKKGEITTKKGKDPKHVAIIHCVGSRNQKYHEYCSHTCCMTALKYANQIKSELPDSHIYEIYSDMRTFGKGCEELYTRSSRKNIKFFMFDPENGLPKIVNGSSHNHCELLIELDEKMSGKKIGIPVDMVILMVAMEAHEDTREISHAAGVSMCGNHFYMEKHPKLDPVATTTSGVYIVGSCQGPKDIPDSVAQARAAAARILADISVGNVEVETTTAEVNGMVCCGCQTCVRVCPYNAIRFDPVKKVSVVNEILCKGCGTCGSACPTGAIKSKHFTDEQILAQIKGILYKA
jgi:heterodisulfide reductase subunit A